MPPLNSVTPQIAGGRNSAIEARPRNCSSMSASDAPVMPKRLLGAPPVERLTLGSPIDQVSRLIQPINAIAISAIPSDPHRQPMYFVLHPAREDAARRAAHAVS